MRMITLRNAFIVVLGGLFSFMLLTDSAKAGQCAANPGAPSVPFMSTSKHKLDLSIQIQSGYKVKTIRTQNVTFKMASLRDPGVGSIYETHRVYTKLPSKFKAGTKVHFTTFYVKGKCSYTVKSSGKIQSIK